MEEVLGNNNNQALIHAGIETVVIGGVVFWFQRKTSILQSEIDGLRDKLAQCEQIMQQQSQIINQHDQLLRQIVGGGPPPGSQLPLSSPKTPPEVNPHSDPPQRSSHPEPPKSSPNPNYQREAPVPDPKEPEDLDKLLAEELGKLNSSSQPDYIEIDCIDNECQIPKGVKKRSRKGKRKGRQK